MDGVSFVGLGCMRLSTAADRDDERSIAVLHAALDAGVTLLDTADAYCLGDQDIGHNERLIARALAGWSGDRGGITVATKGGLTRPRGRWVPDGRAKHLVAACEASLEALGVDSLDLYQLHTPDPRTSLATSVRALARLRDGGKVRRLGLCNVTVQQLDEARRITGIDAVQVSLSPFDVECLRNGLAEYCRTHRILLLAHTPLGGPRGAARLQRDAVVRSVADARGDSPAEITLAWLRSLADIVVPIPGVTRIQTADSAAWGQSLELNETEIEKLDERFPASRVLRVPRAKRQPPADAGGEVVVLMGIPAAGKSTQVQPYLDRGYQRLNRDERGGRLSDLLPELERGLAAGCRRFVLDNTYPKRSTRNEVIELAWRHGVPVRCVWLQTTLEEAQFNAVSRMIDRYGRLLLPEEIKEAARKDPSVFPPRAQFDYQRTLEPPAPEEGFTSIDIVAFERRVDTWGERRGLLVEYELLRENERRVAALASYRDEGWIPLGLSWEPGIAEGSTTKETVERGFVDLHERLGVELDVAYCPHGPGPPVCWCRKPLPGLGVALIRKHGLDPARCLHVGKNTTDRAWAKRLGFQYTDASEFFSPP